MSIENVVGHTLDGLRAGTTHLAFTEVEAPATIEVSSPAFAAGQFIPELFTAFGGEVFPPLRWGNLPDNWQELCLIVEDADSPTPRPIVHCIVYGIDEAADGLNEGSIPGQHHQMASAVAPGMLMGKNTYGGEAWLGPRPVSGHGPHHYHFQVFALSERLHFEAPPDKSDVVEKLKLCTIAKGELIGVVVNDR